MFNFFGELMSVIHKIFMLNYNILRYQVEIIYCRSLHQKVFLVFWLHIVANF